MEIERLGPYQIVGKLGRGGMGTVYEGVHRETGEPAAVKLLSAALAQEEGFRSRFEAEIETLRKLNHPNIVRLFGFGEQEGHLFYSMELVNGNSLEEELRHGRRFEWREVTRIGIETCRALRHAHDRGVIHRDIKPGNLLMTADGTVKLSDFGIARLFGYSKLTSAGSVLGTAEYMAPEQAEGRPVDQRADLYSLGSLLYALLAQRPVFRGKSLPEMLHQQRFEQPEPIRKYAPDVPEELERILSQLLEKDPARRIPNADILARRLESMLHALSLGPETVEAGKSWFLTDTDGATVVPKAAEDAVGAAPPAGDLQVTQAMTQKTPEAALDDKAAFDKAACDITSKFAKAPALDDAAATTIFSGALKGPPPVPPAVSADKASSDAGPPIPPVVPPAILADQKIVIPVPPASPVPPVPPITPVPPTPPVPPVSRFVAVSEEELDEIVEEEPRPVFSWQTGAIVIALALMGATALWVLKQPTADELYQRIKTKTADGTIQSIRQAEDDINNYLDHYSNKKSAAEIRKYQTEIELDRMQREFDLLSKRLVNKKKLQPIGQAYAEARNYVQLDPEVGMAKLQAIVDLYEQPGHGAGASEQELCLILVNRHLAQLRGELKKRQADQLEMIQDRLSAADALQSSDPNRAEAMYRAVVELYGQKPWAAEPVERRRKALQAKTIGKP